MSRTEPIPSTAMPSRSWRQWRVHLDAWVLARKDRFVWGVLPSSTDFVVVIAYLAALASPVFGADVFWHLRSGQFILAGGDIPSTNTFSFTAPSYPWIDNEWLAQVWLHQVSVHFGPQWLLMLRGAFFAIALGFLYRLLRRKGGVIPSLSLTFVSLIVAVPYLRLGPAMVALPFFVVLLFLLEDPDWRKSRSMVLLPLLFLLWANLHGSFFIGLFVLLLHIAGSIWDYRKGKGDPMWFYHLIGLLPAVLFTLWNPYYSEIYLKGLGKIWETMSTFPLWVTSNSSGVLFLTVGLLTVITSFQVRDVIRWRYILPFLGLGAFVLVHRDAMAEAVFLAAVTIMQNLQLLADRVQHAPKKSWAGRESTRGRLRIWALRSKFLSTLDRRLNGRTYILLMMALTLISFSVVPGETLGVGPFSLSGIRLEERLPAHVAPRLATKQLVDVAFPKARVLARADMAGYVIYRGFPELRVFVDRRFSAYPPEIIEDYERFFYMDPGWEEVLNFHQVDFILWNAGAFQARALATGGHWNVLYEDRETILLGRSLRRTDAGEAKASEGEDTADEEAEGARSTFDMPQLVGPVAK